MIWITGDKHGELDAFQHPSYKKIKKNDTLIICGDFGFLWEDSKREQKYLKWLSKRRYEIAFVEGCHENYDLLRQYEMVDYHGGKAREIASNIHQLLRGEIYEIDEKKLLSFGGGTSERREEEDEGRCWWREEIPTDEEIDNAIEHLKQAEGKVNLIVSHEPPLSVKGCMEEEIQESDLIHDVLEQIRTHCQFDQWFFGKFHSDKSIPPFYRAVFDDLVPIP